MLNQQNTRSPVASIDASLPTLFKIRQNRHESLVENCKRFFAVTEVLKHIDMDLGRALVRLTGGILKTDHEMVKNKAKQATTDDDSKTDVTCSDDARKKTETASVGEKQATDT